MYIYIYVYIYIYIIIYCYIYIYVGSWNTLKLHPQRWHTKKTPMNQQLAHFLVRANHNRLLLVGLTFGVVECLILSTFPWNSFEKNQKTTPARLDSSNSLYSGAADTLKNHHPIVHNALIIEKPNGEDGLSSAWNSKVSDNQDPNSFEGWDFLRHNI